MLSIVEGLLWVASAAFLGVAAWTVADASWFQEHARARLVDRPSAILSHTAAAVRSSPAPGEPLARLVIPRLDLDVVVAEGDSDNVLRRAVGRVPGGAHLGEKGNVTLAGHRDTFFRPLEQIRVGDSILVERDGSRERFRVEWVAVVDPGRVEVQGPTGYPALTLVTCYPFRYIGQAPYRFVVRARRSDPAASDRAAV